MSEPTADYEKKLAVMEVVLDNIKENTANIIPMKQTIDRLTIIQENQQKSIDLLTKTLEEMKTTSMRVGTIEHTVEEHSERLDKVEDTAAEHTGKLKIIDTNKMNEAELSKERMKSRYALIGVVITAFASLAVSIVAIFA